MNVLLWVLQGALAVLFVAGGAYKVSRPDELATRFAMLPRGGWRALGAIEMLGGVLLLVPRAVPVAAAVLALESLALSVLYARRSLAWTAANPLVWSLAMAALTAFTAYGRYAL